MIESSIFPRVDLDSVALFRVLKTSCPPSAIKKMDLKPDDNDNGLSSEHSEFQQGDIPDQVAAVEASMLQIHSTESKRILRKVDLRVIPILAILYFLSFLDRGNSS